MPEQSADAATDASVSEGPDALPDRELEFACSVALDAFSGPLDLLLFLVRRAEVDVVDIPITAIADQFVATVAAWADLDLELAGEFILMAATLLEIKARLIAPPPEEPVEADGDEESVDLRAGLVAKLLAYRRFKEAALDLASREDKHAQRLTRQLREDIPEDPEEAEGIDLENADPYLLAATWELVNKRISGLGPRTVVSDPVTLEHVFAELIATMRERGQDRLSRLFAAQPTKVGRVTTMMAVLECTRQRFIEAQQHGQYEDVELRFRAESERPVVVTEFAPEPPPPRRQKRPPLATWQPIHGGEPGAEAGAEDIETEPDEAPIESDEQRFLRELEEACAIDAVLERSADIETGFARFWAEKRGEPWPPPSPVLPPPPAPVPAAEKPAAPTAMTPAKPRGRPFQKKEAVIPAPATEPAAPIVATPEPAPVLLLLMHRPTPVMETVAAPVVAAPAANSGQPTADSGQPAVEGAPLVASVIEPVLIAPVTAAPAPIAADPPAIIEAAPAPVSARLYVIIPSEPEPAVEAPIVPAAELPPTPAIAEEVAEPTPVTTAALVDEPEPVVASAPIEVAPAMLDLRPEPEPAPPVLVAGAALAPPLPIHRAPLPSPEPLPVVSAAKGRTRATTLDRPFRPRGSTRRQHAIALSATLVLVAIGSWLAYQATHGRAEPTEPPIADTTVAPPRIEIAGPAALGPGPAPLGAPDASAFAERLLAAQRCADLDSWCGVALGDRAPAPPIDRWMGMSFAPLSVEPAVIDAPGAPIPAEPEPHALTLPPPPAEPAPGIAQWLARLLTAEELASFVADLGDGLPAALPKPPEAVAEAPPQRAFAYQREAMMSSSAWLVLWAWGEAPPPTP